MLGVLLIDRLNDLGGDAILAMAEAMLADQGGRRGCGRGCGRSRNS